MATKASSGVTEADRKRSVPSEPAMPRFMVLMSLLPALDGRTTTVRDRLERSCVVVGMGQEETGPSSRLAHRAGKAREAGTDLGRLLLGLLVPSSASQGRLPQMQGSR